MVNFNKFLNGSNIKGFLLLLLLAMAELACEAKTIYKTVGSDYIWPSDQAGQGQGRKNGHGNVKSAWRTQKGISGPRNKNCDFTWESVKGEEYQQPEFYLVAVCNDCPESCEPVTYPLWVRINNPENKHWKKKDITVAFVHSH
ncbi:uncharacterized protein LOC114524578 isoform X1 [Dendronephthya gigantea]|uniref:uncharacterized protein LOC114524578 isoform X1 n=1 Tax=Dendronephthya gigantea TaxID=151771 RepID=UPI00106AFB24|nr:uncharacterized protein LOC114524578 isoform X1 [Dendronephthya gigantea]